MKKSIYTDLAMEARELSGELSGVIEQTENFGDVTVDRIEITDPDAAQQLGKQPGKYITIDAPDLVSRPLDLFEQVSRTITNELIALAGELSPTATVLVVGLGNRYITPDSLGPSVAEKVYVTRHINQMMPEALSAPTRSVCAFAPGVLGVTGVETLEVIRGVVEHVKPDLIIIIDSLASRRAARISTTVQLTNAGISPGSGVGNTRAGLSKQELGVPVIAIGVPMVVNASTISQDTISLIVAQTGMQNDEDRLLSLAEKVMDEHIGPLIVTPKDIDTIVDDMSVILSNGINRAILGERYDEVHSLIA
ncbi:MAG: GPR endopeptidase [Clostridia bacterium]